MGRRKIEIQPITVRICSTATGIRAIDHIPSFNRVFFCHGSVYFADALAPTFTISSIVSRPVAREKPFSYISQGNKLYFIAFQEAIFMLISWHIFGHILISTRSTAQKWSFQKGV
jgi:hypothetical protein